MLTESEVWQQIRRLEGSLVSTVIYGRPNKILRVTNNAVVIDKRVSKPSRAEIYSLYKQVHEMGKVARWGDARRRTYAVTYAILIAAIPTEIEAIPGEFLGIRLVRHSRLDSHGIVKLIDQARYQYDRAQECLKAVDWAGYGKELEVLKNVLDKLSEFKDER